MCGLADFGRMTFDALITNLNLSMTDKRKNGLCYLWNSFAINVKMCVLADFGLTFDASTDKQIQNHRISTPWFILDGNSEIGAHVRSNLCYLIC